MDQSAFDGKTLVVVTGSNRGYGLQICIESLSYLADGSLIVMIGRNKSKLELACEKVQQGVKNIRVKAVVCDLSVLTSVSEAVEQCFNGEDLTSFKQLVLFNNAASLGDVAKTMDEIVDPQAVATYFNLNVSSCYLFTAQLLNRIKSSPISAVFVVNISSLMAVEAHAGCSLYCTGKAARDMMFQTLAVERPDIKVLNWAPGPMPTDMLDEMMGSNTHDKEMIQGLHKMVNDKTIVQCSESTKKLMELLKKNQFSSGSHIDYFDV